MAKEKSVRRILSMESGDSAARDELQAAAFKALARERKNRNATPEKPGARERLQADIFKDISRERRAGCQLH